MATTESAVIDLPTWFEAESEYQEEPARGRVSVDRQELTLQYQSGEIAFSLSAVTDVRPGHVPEMLGPVPPGRVPVTLAFATDDRLSVALVANREPVTRKFALCLITAILDGNPIRVKHPARLGDARPETPFERGTLDLSTDTVGFDTDTPGEISSDNVTAFGQTRGAVNGVEKRLIAIDYVRDGTPCRSLLQPSDSQTASLLGRYLEMHTQ